jgi:hypothetical protein
LEAAETIPLRPLSKKAVGIGEDRRGLRSADQDHTLKEGESVDKIVRISGGFLLGFLVGAGAVVMLAPRSGAETRYAIQERVEAVFEAGRQAADERRLELTAQLEDLKQPGLQRGGAGAEGL